MDEEVVIRFGGDVSAVSRALRGLPGIASNAIKPIGGFIKEAFSHFVIPLDVFGAIGKVKDVLGEVFSEVKQITRVSQETGMGIEEWQRLAYAYEEVGGGAEQAERSLGRLNALIGEASSGVQSAQDVFARWNISIYDASGNVKTAAQIYREMASVIDDYASGTDRAAMMQDLLGDKSRTAAEAMKAFKGNQEGLVTASKEAVEQLDAESRQLERLGHLAKAFTINATASAINSSPSELFKKSLNAGPMLTLGFASWMGHFHSSTRATQNRMEGENYRGIKINSSGGVDGGYGPNTPRHSRDIQFEHELADARQRAAQTEAEGTAKAQFGEERLNEMIRRKLHLNREIEELESKGNKTEEEKKQLLNDIGEIAQNNVNTAVLENQLAVQRVLLEEDQMIAMAAVNKARRNMDEGTLDPYKSTLGELADRAGAPRPEQATKGPNYGRYGGGEYAEPNAYGLAYNIQIEKARLAQDIQNYGDGNAALKKFHKGWADDINAAMKVLEQAGYLKTDHVTQGLQDSLKEANQHLDSINKHATVHGVKIKPVNGE